MRDITELIKRLQEKEKQAAAGKAASDMIEAMPDALIVLDLNGVILFVNPAMTKMLGYKPEERIGKSFDELGESIKAEDIEKFMKLLGELIETGQVEPVETVLHAKDGRKIPTSVTYSLIKDAEGNPKSIIASLRDITELKRLQEEEKETAAAKAAKEIMDSTIDVVYMLDLDGNMVRWNKAMVEITGYSAEELDGKPAVEFIAEEYREMAAEGIKEAFEKGFATRETQLLTKEGKEIPYSWSTAILKDEEGNIRGIVGIGKDITECKRAEEEIRKLSSAVEQAIDGIAIYDLDRKLSYVNDAFALMHGYSPEEMIGMKVENLHNEKRLDEYRKGMNQIKAQGSWTGETWHLKKDGTLFSAFMSVSLLKGDDGNHPGILAVARDITKQKRAEVRLQEREAQYRGIFNSATDSLLIFDTDGNIEEVNPQACEMYGYLYEELITLSGKDIVHPDYYHVFEQFKRDVQTTGEFHVESIDVRKDGTPFNIEFKGAVFNYKGEPHLLAIVRDITERKRAEERVKEAYRLRENFLKETSHRIITPVTIIGGNAEVLLDSSNLDDVQKARIRTIQEKNEEVQKLVMDALAGRYLKEEEGDGQEDKL